MNKETGGLAFPCPMAGDWPECDRGMTLRDYLAAKALQGFWAAPNQVLDEGKTFEQNQREMCELFYSWADAMLQARKS